MPVTPVCVPSPNVGTHGYVTIVDQQGYVIGTIATSDGAAFGSVSGESQFLYNNGGPPLANGVPSQLSFDRTRSYLGKGQAQGTISATSVGDTSLIFSVAPKTIMPGQAVLLTGGAGIEYVYVAPLPTYAPSLTATTVPLQSPVVYAGQTIAVWDAFSVSGPSGIYSLATGVGLSAMALQVPGNASHITIASNADNDLYNANYYQGVVSMRMGSSSGNATRERAPDTFKPFNAQAVPITGGTTPISIWTPAAGKKFRLMGYWFSTTIAAGLVFHDLASVGSGGVMPCPSPIHPAAGIIQSPAHMENGILSALANNQLWIDATAATTLTGFVFGVEE